MLYKTPYGHKYHIKAGCYGATMPATVPVSDKTKGKDAEAVFCIKCMGRRHALAGHAFLQGLANGSHVGLSDAGEFVLVDEEGNAEGQERLLLVNPLSEIDDDAFSDLSMDDFQRVLAACEGIGLSPQRLPMGLSDEVVKDLSQEELCDLIDVASLLTEAGAKELRRAGLTTEEQEAYAFDEGYAKLSPKAQGIFDRLGARRRTASDRNNETVGISAEVALADLYGVGVTSEYRRRGDRHVQRILSDAIDRAIRESGCRLPTEHVAEGGSDVDFRLEGGKTLSMKTNKKTSRMVAPQRTGQMTFQVARQFLQDVLGDGAGAIPDPGKNPKEFVEFYKREVCDCDNMAKILGAHFDSLFECDALVYCRNADSNNPSVTVCGKYSGAKFDPGKLRIHGNKTAEDWNNSISVWYDGLPLGSFQVEDSRHDFKFRFTFPSLLRLLEERDGHGRPRLEATRSDAYKRARR